MAGCLIDKVLESWSDYIKTSKHKEKLMSFKDIIVHIKIEEHNKLRDISRSFESNEYVIKAMLLLKKL